MIKSGRLVIIRKTSDSSLMAKLLQKYQLRASEHFSLSSMIDHQAIWVSELDSFWISLRCLKKGFMLPFSSGLQIFSMMNLFWSHLKVLSVLGLRGCNRPEYRIVTLGWQRLGWCCGITTSKIHMYNSISNYV